MAKEQRGQSQRWIEGLKSETPLAEAARIAIDVRLHTAMKRLYGLGSGESPDDVRKLRVAFRRAAVALRAFQPILPRSQSRRLRRRMNRIRRAAGRLRDCDVHLELLKTFTEQDGPQSLATTHIRGILERKRTRRCRRLVKLVARKSARLEERTAMLLDWMQTEAPHHRAGAVTGRPAPILTDLAGPALNELLPEIHAAASADLDIPDRLHELRIACRRLRYAIELFAGALPPTIRSNHYPRLIKIQDRIGQSADLYTLLHRLERIARRARTREEAPDLREGLDIHIERCRESHDAAAQSAIAYLHRQGLRDIQRIEQELKLALNQAGRSS